MQVEAKLCTGTYHHRKKKKQKMYMLPLKKTIRPLKKLFRQCKSAQRMLKLRSVFYSNDADGNFSDFEAFLKGAGKKQPDIPVATFQVATGKCTLFLPASPGKASKSLKTALPFLISKGGGDPMTVRRMSEEVTKATQGRMLSPIHQV